MRVVNIWRLRKFSTAQERFEKTWRLENLQFYVDHLAVLDAHKHRALTLNPGGVINFDTADLAHADLVTEASTTVSCRDPEAGVTPPGPPFQNRHPDLIMGPHGVHSRGGTAPPPR
jgi:hypothetical protein